MVTVSDDFNRADGGLGADWTALAGTWAIVSNQAEVNDDDGPTGYYARFDGSGADAGSPDMWAEVVTNSTQTNGSSNTGPGVRHRSGATTGYQFPTNLNDSCSFWRVNAGSETQIATFTTAIAVGDTVRLEAVGRTFRFKVNGALRNLLQDTNIADGQRGAMNGYNNVGTDVVRIDSFASGPMTDLVAPYVADWSAQTARITGTPSTPTIPAQVTAGDLVVVPATVRSTTSNITAPAGEGWEQVQLASGNSLRMYAFAKIWGLGGQTDDTTPSFAKDTGTVGFFTHALIFRNPAHATAPWTSVASAIVASNQQSNAASATVTAPSVTHDGTHRTIVRLFSSADDNALNAPSEGVLVTGGAAYDATDIAQACSVIEDVTVTTSTGTATVTESVNGNDANNGITLVIAVPSGTAVTGAGDVSGTGTIAGAGVVGVTGTGQVTGTGSISGAGVRGTSGSGAVSGTGSIAGAGVRGTSGSGTVTGTGSVTAAGTRGVTGAGSVAGTGAVAATGVRGVAGAGVVAGTGLVAAQGVVGRSGAGAVTGVGAVAAAGVRGVVGAGQVSGVGAITGTGVVTGSGQGTGQVTGTGSIAASGQRGVLGTGTVSGVGAISAAGRRHVTGSGSVSGTGTITGRGQSVGQDVPSQGTYDSGGRALVYDGASPRTYDPRARRVYDP